MLISNLSNDINSLYQEKINIEEDQKNPSTPILSAVRVKSGAIPNDELSKKLAEIDKCLETPVLMLGMTGYNDYRELA